MNNMAKGIIFVLSVLVVAGIATVVIILNFNQADTADGSQSIDEMNEYSYTTPEVTTDLEDGRFVRIQFLIVSDGKKAVQEVEKREFQIKNLLIKEISLMSEEDFTSGLTELEKELMNRLNDIMQDGKITDVYTISKILQ